ncbi:MAG: TM2 domain-containing protein [Clostridia bacterium]|nr:TM2 domain-containing protein [Clostridia bacterium]
MCSYVQFGLQYFAKGNNEKAYFALLTLSLGVFVVHRFMAKRYPLAVVYACTFGLFFVGAIVDFVNVLKGKLTISDS